jgi:hypothetical protein
MLFSKLVVPLGIYTAVKNVNRGIFGEENGSGLLASAAIKGHKWGPLGLGWRRVFSPRRFTRSHWVEGGVIRWGLLE